MIDDVIDRSVSLVLLALLIVGRCRCSATTTMPMIMTRILTKLVLRLAPGISATPHEDNLRYFNMIITGPTQSAFDGTWQMIARTLARMSLVPANERCYCESENTFCVLVL